MTSFRTYGGAEVLETTDDPVFVHGGLDLTWVDNKSLCYAAVVFCVISCVISFSDLRDHLWRFDYPKLQVLEMRIVLMVPIYAIFSALSLIFSQWRFFFETVRDTYESFVLYMFFMLMIAYCGGEGQLLRSLKKKRYKGMHPFPVCFLPSFPLDTNFYLRCKRWVLQCALIKPVCSFIAMVTHPLGIYNEGSFAVNNVYTYTCIIINFSLTMALYYLVLFEIECGKEMHYAKTFLKFLCIKSIIFFSYWQSVGVSVCSSLGLFYLGSTEAERETNSALIQDLLMCFELLPVALMHRAAFGRSKLDEEMACVPVYMKDSNTGNLRSNVDTALNVNDIIDDTIGTIFYRRGKLVDQENGGESDEEAQDPNGDGGGAGAAAAGGDGGGDAVGASGLMLSNADAFARDPTLEELVRHAIASDDGVRVDGVLHYDEDSDRDERNYDMNFADTDVILHPSKRDAAAQEVRVDTDLLRSSQAKQAMMGTPQIYCVVCGRFDREMVRRRNGYKCKECIGTKSQSLLRTRQREALEDTMSAAVGPGGGSSTRRASTSHRMKHRAASVVAIEVLPLSDEPSPTSMLHVEPRSAQWQSSGSGAMDSDDSRSDAHDVQPAPTANDADLVGAIHRPTSDPTGAAALLADGVSSLQQVLQTTFQGPSAPMGGSTSPYAAASTSVGPPAASVQSPGVS